MFFANKKFEENNSPRKDNDVAEIFNFDEEDNDDDDQVEQLESNVLRDYILQQEKEGQITYIGVEENVDNFQTNKEQGSGLFGINQRLQEENSDNEALDLDEQSMMQIDEDIKSYKKAKKNKLKVQFQEPCDDDEEENQFTQKKPKQSQRGQSPQKAIQKNKIPEKIVLDLYIPNIVDMRSFLNTPIPPNHIMQCTITRNKAGINYFYPAYSMKISESGQYLLTAKKMSLQKTSYYLLTMNENHLSRKSESFLGKIRSNFLGTEYLFYDNGDNPAKTTNLENVRRQLGIVYYESNFLVSRGPRRMSLVIPRLDINGEPKQFQPLKNEEGIQKEIKQKNQQNIQILVNKIAKWNAKNNAFVLNFSGRVTKASVKNFQLIYPGNEEQIMLQFGRVQSHSFNIDFQHPFTPLQAFSVCVTQFDYKFACD